MSHPAMGSGNLFPLAVGQAGPQPANLSLFHWAAHEAGTWQGTKWQRAIWVHKSQETILLHPAFSTQEGGRLLRPGLTPTTQDHRWVLGQGN